MAYNRSTRIVFFCASLLFVAVIDARPQVWNIGFNPNRGLNSTPAPAPTSTAAAQDPNNPTPSTAPPAPVTTPSPQYYDCLSRCPTTSEYNPICGSDSVNYHNMGRLNCAARCGTNVTMVRAGTCTPAG